MTLKTHLVLRIMALFLPAFVLFFMHSRQDSEYYDQYRQSIYEKMPYQSADQIYKRLEEVRSLIARGPEKKGIASGRMYFSLLYELDFTGLYCEQIQYDQSVSNARNAQGGRSWSTDSGQIMQYRDCQLQTSNIATSLGNYTPKEVLHSKEWEGARDAYVPLRPIKGGYPRTDKTMEAIAFFAAYVISILLARGYIHGLIRDSGGRVWLAMLSSFGYWYFQIVWLHLIVRGFQFNPKQQLRQALRFASTTLSAVLSLGAAVAQTKKPKEERVRESDPITWVWKTTIENQVKEEYHGLNGASFLTEPVSQTNFTFNHRSGWFAGVWHSVGLNDKSPSSDFGDEIDLYGGYSRSFGGTSVTSGVLLFNIIPLETLPRGDLLQPDIRVSHTVVDKKNHKLSPFVWVRYVFPVGEGPKAGLFLHYGSNHTWQFGKRVTLNHNLELLHDVNGAFGFNKAWVAGWYGQLRIKLTDKLQLIAPSFRLSTPITHVDDGRATMATFGGGFVYSFGSQ